MKRIAVVTLMLFFVACAGRVQPARQYEDTVLAQAVRDALRADTSIRFGSLSVNARTGVVTLRGLVGSALQRNRAEEVVRGVQGVTRVENLLSITDELIRR